MEATKSTSKRRIHVDTLTVEAPVRKCAKTNFAFYYGFFAFWAPAVWDPPHQGPKSFQEGRF